MPTNRTRRARHARPTVTPLQHAMLTGTPLPDSVGAMAALPIHASYLNDISPTGFRALWRSYHGRDMTDADVAGVVAREAEIETAVERTRLIRGTPAPGSNHPSNWPSTEGPTNDR